MSHALICLGMLLCPPASGQPRVLNDFEDGAAPGWYAYEDPEGVIEVLAAPDAAVGEGAVRVSYTKAGRWGYWDRPVDASRASACNAISLWIRGDGSDVNVVPRIVTAEGESHADPILLADTEWRQVTIRLAHFYPRRSPDGLAKIKLFRLTRLGVPKPFHTTMT